MQFHYTDYSKVGVISYYVSQPKTWGHVPLSPCLPVSCTHDYILSVSKSGPGCRVANRADAFRVFALSACLGVSYEERASVTATSRPHAAMTSSASAAR